MKNLPTGTVTFLFTDIEGSTTLLQRLGDRRYAEVLADHHRLLRQAFAERNGQEIDTQGDAFLVAFPRARDALAAAVAAQQSLLKHPWPDGASLRLRMGLHTGEPLSGETGYVGLDIHRAARIAAVGHGGQILVSDVTHGLVAWDLPKGVSLRDLGEHRLKDLARPDHLFQVVAVDLPADFPPLKSLNVLPNNLPVQLTSFIGREREKAEVRRLLSSTRFLTLTGSGGEGKTRLALQVAAEGLEGFPDGVWLVELAVLSDPSLVPKAVASALGVPEQPGRSLTETLTDSLRGKSILVILDNCEHLVAACAHLASALLRACPNLIILATSREALGVTGETTWRVTSLSLPDPERLPPLDQFTEYEAIRLFVDRAVATAPQFAVTNRNALAIAQICHRLDGIPLAIELAAARVKVLAVEQIASRLDDRFRLLTGGSRTALPRQQTLRAAMDWSYRLLTETERWLLQRLSVFAGGWTLDAAEGVCTGGNVEATDILELLTSLVDKSLVLAETQRGEARYRLLDTVRQYARDRLAETGDEADVRTRHRAWYVAFAERADREYRGPRQRIWRDYDNLRAALVWGKEDPGGAEATLRLVGALIWFWWLSGNLTEPRGWIEEALIRKGDAPRSVLPEVYWGAAHFAWRFDDYERAKAFASEGLAIARDLGDKWNGAFLEASLGIVAMRQMVYRDATKHTEEAVRLAREAGDKWRLSICLNQQGIVARFQGNLGLAGDLHKEALSLSEDTADPAIISYTLRWIGFVALQQGDYQYAVEVFMESLRLSREAGYRVTILMCLLGLADVFSALKQDDRAARLFAAAEALRAAIGHLLAPQDQAEYEGLLASARSRLGAAPFAAAWAEGRAMTLEQAIDYALATETG
ncbi:MAG TPA: adenylate/guanylate cyclase domain-containing protein [bacterium]|nr:adenylate/guanylate cyclase domain-containing protein [bacterium]